MFLPIFKPIIISCMALLWSFVTFRFKVCVWLGWAKQPRRFHAVHNAPVHNTQNIPRLSGWGTKRCMTFRFDFLLLFTISPNNQTWLEEWWSLPKICFVCRLVLSNSSTAAKVWNFYTGPNQWIVDRLCHLMVGASAVVNVSMPCRRACLEKGWTLANHSL